MDVVDSSYSFPDELIPAILDSTRVAILTGSGISAESGVPTFRQAQTGLWSQFDPQSLATPEAFQRDPKLVWEWYRWRRELISKARPNPGHLALVELNDLVRDFSLITQNVDGLHQRAGSTSVIELHGNIMRSRCTRDGNTVEEVTGESDQLPYCPDCGSMLRPDVVWYGESLPSRSYHDALDAARSCDIFFSIGTSSVVQPAASLSLEARAAGGRIVEINIEETPLTGYADFFLKGTAGKVLPSLIDSMKRR